MRPSKWFLSFLALSFSTSSALAANWTWWTKNGELAINMDGQIVPGDSAYFAKMVKLANARGRRVMAVRLNSPGGNVLEGAALADEVRSGKIATVVVHGSMCASACFLVFAAGETKYASAESWIGVHGVSIDGKENELTESTTLLMARAVKALGAPPSIVAKMVTIPPSQVGWLTANEVREMGATVTGMTATSAATPGALSIPPVALKKPSGGIPSTPPNYHLVFANKDEIVIIDASRIEQEPQNIRQAWTVSFRAPGHRIKHVAYLQILGDYDCAASSYRDLSMAAYDAKQSYLAAAGSGQMDNSWQPSIPESAGDASLKFICEPPTDWRTDPHAFGEMPLTAIANTLLNRSWPAAK